MSYHLHTKRGYSFPAVSSAMQKAVRRGDAKLAGYWALELWASGFGQYVWRRLLTVSAEDCWGILTAEVKALHDSYTEINANTREDAERPHLHFQGRDPALPRQEEPRRRPPAKLRL